MGKQWTIQGHKIGDLHYDTSLLSHSVRVLSNLVEAVDKHSGKKCFNLNAKKTKLMKTDKTREDLEIKVNGETLEIVSKYVYLGSTISGAGDWVEEIRKRLAMAMHKLTKMKFLWEEEDPQTKLRILWACIFHIATYGCEAWTLDRPTWRGSMHLKWSVTEKNLKDFLDRAQNEQVNKRRTSSGRTIAKEFCEETKAEIFWSFEKEWGIREDYLRMKDKWEKRKRKTKKAMENGHRGCFYEANNRSWNIGIR